ncbi:MAG: F0F1 ATP synthase subunit A [bacterium]|nr:F0F1 ATP synthase subunit A [bacterium]
MAAFAPEAIFHIGSFPVTNTIINTLLVDAGLVGTAYYIKTHIKKVPGIFQNTLEIVMQSFYETTTVVSGKNAAKIFPYFMTFFLFILFANWSNLIPGIGTFGFIEQGEHGKTEIIPFIRGATSDANTTFALALFSLLATHILAIRAVGIGEYLSRYFSLNPIMLFVGILEIVSEFTKVVSLSFRLFGNIFAGEVVMHTVSSLFAFLAPVPFLLLEIIVGLVQALVFAMLTMVFMSVLMTPHHQEH